MGMLDLKNAVRIRTSILNHEYKNTDQGHENCRFIGRRPAEGFCQVAVDKPGYFNFDEPTSRNRCRCQIQVHTIMLNLAKGGKSPLL